MKSLFVILATLLLIKGILCDVTFSTSSDPSTFASQLQTPYNNDDYSSSTPGDSYQSAVAGYDYLIESYPNGGDSPDFDAGIDPIYTSTGTLLIQSGGYADSDYLFYDFTGSPNDAFAVGGYVFLSNSKGQVETGTLQAYVNGALVGSISSVQGSSSSYITIVSDTAINSISFQAPTATGNVYVTVYSFIVGKLISSIIADPHFIGLDGQRYDIVGAPGKIFNLVSQPHVQINARFDKPCEDSANNQDIISELGVLISGHKVYFDLKHTATVDGVPVQARHIKFPIGDESHTIEWTGRHKYSLITPSLNFSVVQDFNFRGIKGTKNCLGGYLDSYYYSIDSNVPIHGLLGQTIHRSEGKEKDNEGAGIIEGVYTDYIVDDLFSFDFKYNQYQL